MAKNILLEQHNACYDDNQWFVSLKTVLDGVTAEHADWRPDGADNTIRETVNHLLFWNERWLKRYRGEIIAPEDIDNDSTFDAAADWDDTVARLFGVMETWREIYGQIDDEKLSSSVSEKYDAPWRSPLGNQNIHNAYHIGQILLLRKLQGSWDPKKGVS
jgi:hypothetical protein